MRHFLFRPISLARSEASGGGAERLLSRASNRPRLRSRVARLAGSIALVAAGGAAAEQDPFEALVSKDPAFFARIRPYVSATAEMALFGAAASAPSAGAAASGPAAEEAREGARARAPRREPAIASHHTRRPRRAPHRVRAPEGGVASAPAPQLPTPGGDVPVNDPTGESCGAGCVQSETSLAVSGSNLVMGYNDSAGFFDWTEGVSGYSYSTDGGATWIDGGGLPIVGDGDRLRGDPAVVFCDGHVYYASIYLTGATASPPETSAIAVNEGTFVDGALVWSLPRVASIDTGGGDFLDKEYIACDRATGDLYVSYTNFMAAESASARGQIELVKSSDGGLTWSSPTIVEPEHPIIVHQGSYPAVGPGGEVYVAWEEGYLGTSPTGRPSIQVRRSLDGGATFPLKTEVAEFAETAFHPITGFNRGTVPDFPSIAVDGSAGPHGGNVYVVFHDADRDLRDIKLARSTDGAASFEPPVRLNDDAAGGDQFFPWVAVSEATGQVGAMWYDRRGGDFPAETDVFFTQSNDGGLSFIPNVRVNDTTFSFLVSADARPNFGDYTNLAADGDAFYASWADGRLGTPDAFFARIDEHLGSTVLLDGFSVRDVCPVAGDDDGVPEPGESPFIDVTLRNVGLATATGVSATLSTATERVDVTQPDSAFPDLSTGSTAAASPPYQIDIDPGLECSACPPGGGLLGSTGKAGGTLIEIDPAKGAAVALAPHGALGPLGEIEFRDDGVLFASTGQATGRIITIDPRTGAESLVGAHQMGLVQGLEFVGPTLYGSYTRWPALASDLVIVDQTSGQLTFIGPTGLNTIGGLAFDPNTDTLYGVTSTGPGGDLVTLDRETGAATLVGPTGFERLVALEFDASGTLYAGIGGGARSAGSLITIDPTTGAGTLVGPTGFPVLNGLTFDPSGACLAPIRAQIDFDLAIETDEGGIAASFGLPLGRRVTKSIFVEDVEAGFGGWAATGEWHPSEDRSASSTRSWYFGSENGPGLADNAHGSDSSGSLTSPVIDLSAATAPELVFRQYLDGDPGFGFATVSASDDGFATSTRLALLEPARVQSFGEVRLSLAPFAGSSEVQVRFTFSSDGGAAFEGWYLDDVSVLDTEIECVLDACAVVLLTAEKDSTLDNRRKNTNEGANPQLFIGWGRRGPVVAFDLSGFPAAAVTSATLVLTVDPARPARRWGGGGQLVGAYRLLSEFTEGNGKNLGLAPGDRFPGTGAGVTWNCASDWDIANDGTDCYSPWLGGESSSTRVATDRQLHWDDMSGDVEWDVTADVLEGIGRWRVQRSTGSRGSVRYYSKEGSLAAFGDLRAAPRLFVTLGP
jgi:hypothetical protein